MEGDRRAAKGGEQQHRQRYGDQIDRARHADGEHQLGGDVEIVGSVHAKAYRAVRASETGAGMHRPNLIDRRTTAVVDRISRITHR
jgi:hypothetical protein